MKNKPFFRHCMILAFVPLASSAQNARTFTYDAAGNRVAMNSVKALAPSKVSNVDERNSKPPFDVYFRSDGNATLSVHDIGNDEVYRVSVYTVSGQLVLGEFPASGPTKTINLSFLPTGVYVVKLAKGQHNHSRVVVKE